MKTRWKILIAVGAGLLASYLFGTPLDPHAPTVDKLKAAFTDFNSGYFSSALPESNVDIILTDLSKYDEMGRFSVEDNGRYLIAIDKKYHPLEKEAELTLAHEMCHLNNYVEGVDEGFDSHGRMFQRCMLRIANHGGFNDLW